MLIQVKKNSPRVVRFVSNVFYTHQLLSEFRWFSKLFIGIRKSCPLYVNRVSLRQFSLEGIHNFLSTAPECVQHSLANGKGFRQTADYWSCALWKAWKCATRNLHESCQSLLRLARGRWIDSRAVAMVCHSSRSLPCFSSFFSSC